MRYFTILRPSHWTKNLFVLATLVFGKKLLGPVDEVLVAVGSAMGGFFCFCAAASSIYIFNDIIDRESDRLHPQKSKRPIAAGTVNIGCAVVLAVICAAVAIVSSFSLSRSLGLLILTYIVLMIAYSLVFKKVMILDCVVISLGFCLRAIAGAVVLGVFISPWLIVCTFTLCLFLGFSKRRGEIALLGENTGAFRETLGGYTPELLAHMLDVSSGLAVTCFLLYAMDYRTLEIFGTNNLVYTTPLVLYCVFRFSALIQKGKYSSPVALILRDVGFQIGFVLWVLSCVAIIYAEILGFSFSGLWSY